MANSRNGENNIYNETVASYSARMSKKGQANRNAMMRYAPKGHGSRLKEFHWKSLSNKIMDYKLTYKINIHESVLI